MKKLLLYSFTLLSSLIYAQLDTGDIVFTGYNSDIGSDGFSFVATKAISATTVIHFTDNGWDTTGSGTFRQGEGFLSYTVPSGGLSKGDVVSIEDAGAGVPYIASDGGTLVANGTVNPATGGDQFFAFTGTVTSNSIYTVTKVLAGIDFYNVGASANVFDATATNSNTTGLPTGLKIGQTAATVGGSNANDDNGRLSFSSAFSGLTAQQIKVLACNSSNWATDGDIIFSLPPLVENTWNGTVWSSGVAPVSGEVAKLGSGQTLTLSSDISISELSLESGATLNIPAGVTLTITGDVTSLGTITGEGTIIFDKANETARLRSDVSFGGGLSIAANTTVVTNDKLTITATSATTSGQLIGTGTPSGKTKCQGWIDLAGGAADGRYYHLSLPVSTNYGDMNNGQTQSIGSTGSLFVWNASTANWEAPSALTDVITRGKGFAQFIGSVSGLDFVRQEAGVIEVEGELTNSDVNVSLGYNNGQSSSTTFTNAANSGSPTVSESQGWNMLGNPYMATYNWSSQTLPSGTGDAFYTWDGTQYKSYVSGVGSNGGTQYIAPFQGFFVQTTNATPGTFTFSQSKRVLNQSRELSKRNPDGLWLVLRNRGSEDDVHIGFEGQSTTAFDLEFDARKLSNALDASSISAVLNGDNYSICRVPSSANTFPIRVSHSNENAIASITLQDSILSSYSHVYLKDKFLNRTIDLKASNYSYQPLQKSSDRFELFLSNQPLSIEDYIANSVEIIRSGMTYSFQLEEGIESIEVYSMSGQLLYSELNPSKNMEFNAQSAPDLFIVKLRVKGQPQVYKLNR